MSHPNQLQFIFQEVDDDLADLKKIICSLSARDRAVFNFELVCIRGLGKKHEISAALAVAAEIEEEIIESCLFKRYVASSGRVSKSLDRIEADCNNVEAMSLRGIEAISFVYSIGCLLSKKGTVHDSAHFSRLGKRTKKIRTKKIDILGSGSDA
jgi:phosphate uptake regulator